MNRRLLLILFSLPLMTGCAAMLVPSTNDPYRKLAHAGALYNDLARPLPAERLIREAIDIFVERNDQRGLALAYREYGYFFMSASIARWEKVYTRDGFKEPGATLENRYEKSVAYFDKSAALLTDMKAYDMLTNVAMAKGNALYWGGDIPAACASYDQSLVHYNQNVTANPDANVSIPDGYASFEDYLKWLKNAAKCPKA